MKVSIVTISFNQASYLARNRESVRAQFGSIEHILVDPGSSDGSRDLIGEWANDDSSVIPVFQPDEGPADGLNNGLMRSSGDVWMYLNADDELAPGAIAAVVEAHSRLRDVDVLIGGGWTIDAEGNPLRGIRSDRFSPARYAMSVGTVLQQGTSFKAARTRGSIAFNKSNRFNWDTEYLFDAYRAGLRFGYTGEPYGYFRLQPESITMSGRYEEGLRAERRRLITSVPGHRLLRVLSPAARALKAASNTRSASAFPGLARV